MHKHLCYFALLCTAGIAATGCSRYYYKPTGVNAPMFTHGGQAHLNLAGNPFGGTDDGDNETTSFFDVQASYSPINHLAVMANYSTVAYRTLNPDPVTGRVDARANMLEGGIGGYYAAGKPKVKMVADLYVGGGSGNLSSDIDARVTKLFIQPGIGMRTPWVDVGFNFRFSNIQYSGVDDNGLGLGYLTGQGLYNPTTQRGIEDGSYTFFEPALTVRGGYKFAKVQLQLVLAEALTPVSWNYNHSRFTVGFYFSLEEALGFDMDGNRVPMKGGGRE